MLTSMEDLTQLQQDSTALADEAMEYHKQTEALSSYFFWKDCKMCVIYVMGGLAVLGLLVFGIYEMR